MDKEEYSPIHWPHFGVPFEVQQKNKCLYSVCWVNHHIPLIISGSDIYRPEVLWP